MDSDSGRQNSVFGILGRKEIVRIPGIASRLFHDISSTVFISQREKPVKMFIPLFNLLRAVTPTALFIVAEMLFEDRNFPYN